MKTVFLIADEIRAETNGKQTVLGLYPDHTLLIEDAPAPSDVPQAINRLSILINISDVPEGEHEFKGRILDPSGNVSGNPLDFGKLSVAKGTSRSFIVGLQNFVLSGKVTYQFNLEIDGESYPCPFYIVDRSGD